MHRHDAQRGLALLMASTGVLTGALHLAGQGLDISWSDPVGWLNAASPEEALATSLRLVGLATGYWVLGTTLLYSITARSRRRVPAWIRISTIPAVRRLVDRALATALAASLAAAPFTPASADEMPPPPLGFDITTDGVPVPHVRLQGDPVPDATESEPTAEDGDGDTTTPPATLVPPAPVATGVPSPAATAAVTPKTVAATNYTVERGDNLWRIADHHLRTKLDDPTMAQVAGYWQQVIAVNDATLRSGDPNLIYPGEIVLLPQQEIAS